MIGKFYLVDVRYGAKLGFLPPFRGVRYHLNEWGIKLVQNETELFNHRPPSLNQTVESAFCSLKRRFNILDDATLFFPFATQVEIVVACCIIHNWVIEDGGDELIIPKTETMPTISHQRSSHGQAHDHAFMVKFRQEIGNCMCGKTVRTTYEPMYFFLCMNLCIFVLCMNLCIFTLYEPMYFYFG
jgi:hypothetical protein